MAMRRPAPALPVSPQMLRHFAVVTLVITASVAMFANGEGQEAVMSGIETRIAENPMIAQSTKVVGAKRFETNKLRLRNEKRSYMAFAPDMPEATREFGTPMDLNGSIDADGSDESTSTEGWEQPNRLASAEQGPPPPGTPNFTKLDPKRPRLSRPRPVRPNAEQLDRLMNASRQRSGAPDEG
jgi:hypothetical protein